MSSDHPGELEKLTVDTSAVPQRIEEPATSSDIHGSELALDKATPFFSWLLQVPPGEPEFRAIVNWWEQRRLAYNLLILASFIPGFIVTIFRWAPFGASVLLVYVVCSLPYFILANICYTSGWICEYAQKRFLPPAALRFGPTLFVFGCILSAIITVIYAISTALFSMLLPIQSG